MEPGDIEHLRRQLAEPTKKAAMGSQREMESFLAATGMSTGKQLADLDLRRLAEQAQGQERAATQIAADRQKTVERKRAELAALMAAEAEGTTARTDDMIGGLGTVAAAYGAKQAAEKDMFGFGERIAKLGVTNEEDIAILAKHQSEGTLDEFLTTFDGKIIMQRAKVNKAKEG